MRELLDLQRLQAMTPEAAAAVLAVRLSDPAHEQEAELLEAWLQQDEANARAWASTQYALGLFEEADDDEILQALRREALDTEPERTPAWTRWAAIAAVLVALAAGIFTIGTMQRIWSPGASSGAQDSPPALTFATARGERRTVTLPDGSTMTLDTDSAVALAFTDARRDLTLARGRALFDVSHDADRPFAVRAGSHEVVALGTRFDVRLDPNRFGVTLEEGRVAVSGTAPGAPPIELRAGQQLVQETGRPPQISAIEAEEQLEWRNGMVSFQDETLAAVADELNRYSNERLIVRDPAVARLRISGTFRTGDVARFGRTIEAIHPVRVVRRGPGEWEILPAR